MTGYTERPVLFGVPYSVYVQAARLALDEKRVEYELVPIDIFTEAGPSAEHLARRPRSARSRRSSMPAFGSTRPGRSPAMSTRRFRDRRCSRPSRRLAHA